jgi:transposase
MVGCAARHRRQLHERLMRLRALFADETTAPVLDPGRGRTKTGQLWPMPPMTVPGPGRIHRLLPMSTRPIAKPSDPSPTWRTSRANGYAGYRKLADRGDVRLAFCWSHVRRNFYELATPGPAPIASEALEHIAALYAVEKEIRGRSADKRRAGRQQKSRSLVDAIEPWSPSRD